MNGWLRLSVIAALTVLAGCKGSGASSDSGATDAGGSADAGGDAGTADSGPGGPITGTCSIRFHFFQDGGAGEQTTTCNLVGFVEAVSVQNSAATTFPATVFGSQFTIDGVPTGPYYLHFPNSGFYISTSVRTFDFQSDQGGKPPFAQASAGTTLTMSGSGFPPLQLADALGQFSWNANDFANVTGFDAGDTSFSVVLTYPLSGFANLIDTTTGDDLTYFHEGSSVDAGVSRAFTLDSIASPSPVVTVNGQVNVAPDAVFSAVALDQTLTLNLDHAAFTALTSTVSPAAAFEYERVDVDPVVGGASAGIFGASAYLLRVYDDSPSANFAGTFAYGNPFGTAVGLAHSHRAEYGILLAAAGATQSAYFNGFVTTDVIEGTQASPEEPVVVPATGLSVGGRAAAQGLSGTGSSPVVSWTSPATGAVSAYDLFIFTVSANGGKTVIQQIAYVRTVSTSVQIPPGILTGGQYLLSLRAMSAPGVDLEAMPFLSGVPFASADTVSGILTP